MKNSHLRRPNQRSKRKNSFKIPNSDGKLSRGNGAYLSAFEDQTSVALRKIAEDCDRIRIERHGIVWGQKKTKQLFCFHAHFSRKALRSQCTSVAWRVAIAARHSQNNLQPKSQRFFSLSGVVLKSTFSRVVCRLMTRTIRVEWSNGVRGRGGPRGGALLAQNTCRLNGHLILSTN